MTGFGGAVKGRWHSVGKQVFFVCNFRSIDNDQRIVRYKQTQPLGRASPRDTRTTADPCQAGPLEGHHRQKHLIQMPFITRPGATAPQPIGVVLSKLPTPLTDSFMGHSDAPLE